MARPVTSGRPRSRLRAALRAPSQLIVLNAITPMRSKPEDEMQGLDFPETGVTAYPDYQLVQN